MEYLNVDDHSRFRITPISYYVFGESPAHNAIIFKYVPLLTKYYILQILHFKR